MLLSGRFRVYRRRKAAYMPPGRASRLDEIEDGG
jgi:hypothetical protein